MIKVTGKESDALLLKLSGGLPLVRRAAKSKDDWGDPQTYGLHMKRAGKRFDELDLDYDFGTFLGKHGDQFAIAIKSLSAGFIAIELFATLADAKQAWELD